MEIGMADDNKSKTGNADRQRINTSQEHELRDWANTAARLMSAFMARP
jgi:hypothetical protein